MMDNNILRKETLSSKLTFKQDRFCIEFIKDFNATKAAERAGHSIKTARAIGYENLTKPHIKSKIAELVKIESMQPEEIKKRLSDIARGDLSDYIRPKAIPYTPKIKAPMYSALI
eukprot:Opistho-2@91400